MSQRQLIDAYLDGRMSRRTLIRRLIAGGASASAAIGYAHALAPGRALGRAFGDLHAPGFTLEIPEQDLDRVVRRARIKVAVTAEAPLTIPIHVRLYRPNHPLYPSGVIAATDYAAPAGSSKVKIPISYNVEGDVKHSLDAIRRRKRIEVGVVASDRDFTVPHVILAR